MRFTLRLAKLRQFGLRGLVKVTSRPFWSMTEGPSKIRIQRGFLRLQHSLPAEFCVNAGDVVVQVGTPRPETVRRFSKLAGTKGRVVIVEAMPENQNRLEQAIVQEGLVNVTLIKGAAFDEARLGILSVSPIAGDHKIGLDGVEMDNDRRPENQSMKEIEVQFLRLDEALFEIGVHQVDYLSVTVNGAEAVVLSGAEGLLRNLKSGARVYAKGHARGDDGQAIHHRVKELLEGYDFDVMITRGEPSSTDDPTWTRRAGDVFAWKK